MDALTVGFVSSVASHRWKQNMKQGTKEGKKKKIELFDNENFMKETWFIFFFSNVLFILVQSKV